MAIKARFEIAGVKSVTEFYKKLPGVVSRRVNSNAVRAATRVLASHTRRNVPVGETGELARSVRQKSIKSRVKGRAIGLAGVFGKEAPLAKLIEYGTGLMGPKARKYEIVPKEKPILSFIVNYRRIFTRKVSHPGIAPDPFVTRSFDAGRAEAGQKYIDTALRGINREAAKLSARAEIVLARR